MKDKQVERLIKGEEKRQKSVVNLIPSDNHSSTEVLKALGSVFNNKYSEGYPGKRYYGGQEFTDKLEELCQERALKLFKLSPKNWHVNVQPLSGSPANLAAYMAMMPSGGKIMGMTLRSGGHLTHGQPVSLTGKVYKQVPFEVDPKTEVLNYTELKKIALEEKPNVLVVGFTAYPRIVDFKKCRDTANACGAYLMVDMSHFAGLVAGSTYPSPFKYADIVTTTTHKTLRGPRGAMIFVRKDRRELDKAVDKAVFPGLQGGPHMHQIAALAVTLFEDSKPAFKNYARQIIKNTQALAKELQRLGWRIVSGGTDSHLILVDVWQDGKGLTGKDAEAALERGGIIVNKNTIPGDERSPFNPSGIRLGAPEVTTRGMKERDMVKIAQKIDKILRSANKGKVK